MALTSSVTHTKLGTAVAATSTTVTLTATSLVLVFMSFEDSSTNALDAATPMTNSGTGMTWTTLGQTSSTNNASVTRVSAYAAISNGAGSRTITHTKLNALAKNRRMSVVVIEGALSTVATAIPSGNRFIKVPPLVANVSQSVTPAGTGSMIFGVAADWNDTNAYAALTGNSLDTDRTAGSWTTTLITPTTNPLASGSAFTWGANNTGGGNQWIVVEVVPAAAGGSPYTLPAVVGAFTLAGIAANTLFGHVAGAVTGTFALTGNDAGLAVGYKVTAITGPFTLTGLDAATITTRALPATVGAFALTGLPANLVYTTVGAYVLGASPGAFALAGNAANLVRTNAYVLSAATGVFALAGQAANLIYAALNNYVMPAATGLFNLSGRQANLLANLLEVQPGRLEFGHVVYLRRW